MDINKGSILEILNTKVDLNMLNVSQEGIDTSHNRVCPDMSKATRFVDGGSPTNLYNFDWPIWLGLTTTVKTDMGIYISDVPNGPIAKYINGGYPNYRVSFTWIVPKNFNFYIIGASFGGTGGELSSFYAPLMS